MFVLMNEFHTEFLGFVKQQITINRSVLQENGNFTWRVSDWWHYLMEHIGRNATNYFKYLMGRYKRAPRGCMLSLPPSLLNFIHLLHLNQAGVQDLISNALI
jgi:hypothetical protein